MESTQRSMPNLASQHQGQEARPRGIPRSSVLVWVLMVLSFTVPIVTLDLTYDEIASRRTIYLYVVVYMPLILMFLLVHFILVPFQVAWLRRQVEDLSGGKLPIPSNANVATVMKVRPYVDIGEIHKVELVDEPKHIPTETLVHTFLGERLRFPSALFSKFEAHPDFKRVDGTMVNARPAPQPTPPVYMRSTGRAMSLVTLVVFYNLTLVTSYHSRYMGEEISGVLDLLVAFRYPLCFLLVMGLVYLLLHVLVLGNAPAFHPGGLATRGALGGSKEIGREEVERITIDSHILGDHLTVRTGKGVTRYPFRFLGAFVVNKYRVHDPEGVLWDDAEMVRERRRSVD